jgi:ketosteroid isomerase-like protein
MSTENGTPAQAMRNYFAMEMTRNLDLIMATYSCEAVFTTPGTVMRGWDEIRPFYEDSVARFEHLDVQIPISFSDGENGVAEWSAKLTSYDGEELLLSGVNVARVVDGLIVDVRSYYDVGKYNDDGSNSETVVPSQSRKVD